MIRNLHALWLSIALIGFVVQPATALTKPQKLCINAMNKSGINVAKAQGKLNATCVKTGGTGAAVDACVEGDTKGKVLKAQTKVGKAAMTKCTNPPPFGFDDVSTTQMAPRDHEIELLHSIFGDDPVLTPGKCDPAATKKFEKIAATSLKVFRKCKKNVLKFVPNPTIGSLENCILDGDPLGDPIVDPKGKVAKAIGKLQKTLLKHCQSVSFPGCTGGNELDCLATAAKCRACMVAESIDDMAEARCDDNDNGALDGTCPQCGNSFPDPDEECDAGEGDFAGCDSDCTLPVCGDGHRNAAAGEQCDDGNNNNGDCCSSTCTVEASGNVCNDGNPCTAPDQCNGSGSCVGTPAPELCPVCESCEFDGPAKAKGLKTSLIRSFAGCPSQTFLAPNSQTGTGVPTCAPPYAHSSYNFDNKKGNCTFRTSAKREKLCSNGSGEPCMNLRIKAKCQGVLNSDNTTPTQDTGWGIATVSRATLDDPDNCDMTVIDFPIQIPLANSGPGQLSAKTDTNTILAMLGLAALPGCTEVEVVSLSVQDPGGNPFAKFGGGVRPKGQ